jgi:hypothetical protein
MVAYFSKGQDISDSGIIARVFDASGNPLSEENQVNSYGKDAQARPNIARLSEGKFLTVWQSYGQDGSGWGIFGHHIIEDGSPVGSDIAINTFVENDQEYPEIVRLASGK